MNSDLQIVFIYDTLSCRKEEDDPREAILYFHPFDIPEERRLALCGQLMGITHFLIDSFSTPQIVTLENIKFALRLFDGQYVLALGSSSKTPDWLLDNQANILFSLTRFFHRDIKSILSGVNGSREMLSKKLTSMMDHYIPLSQHHGDLFALAFGILPVLALSKSTNKVSMHASAILQRCMMTIGVLGGVVMYQNKAVGVELCQDIAQKLTFIQQHELPPAESVKLGFELPVGVNIFTVFVGKQDLEIVKRRAIALQQSACVDADKDSAATESTREENASDVSSSIGFSEVSSYSQEEACNNNLNRVPSSESSSEAYSGAYQDRGSKHSMPGVGSSPTLSTSPLDKEYLASGSRSFSHSDLPQIPGKKNVRPLSSLPDTSSRSDREKLSRAHRKSLYADRNFSETMEAVEVPSGSVPNGGPYYNQRQQATTTSDSSTENSESHSLPNSHCDTAGKDIDITSVMHLRMMNSFRKLSSHEDWSSCQSSSENERTYNLSQSKFTPSNGQSHPLNFQEVAAKHSVLPRPVIAKVKEEPLEKAFLFICYHGCMRLLLLMNSDHELSSSVVHSLNEYGSAELAELETFISNAEEDLPSPGDPYCYLKFEPIWKSLAHSGENHTMNVDLVQRMHKDFTTYPNMSELIIRGEDHVVYGYQCVGSEVYYQQSANLVSGVPMPTDLMGKVPSKAKRRLERDHKIILL